MNIKNITTLFSRNFLLALALGSAQATTLPTAASLGLSTGDQYAFVFVSSTLTTASSSSISTYNTMVQNLANSNGIGNTAGLNWHAIVSTGQTSPNTTNTNAPAGAGVRVFLLDGSLVANVGLFYSATNHLIPINITETGGAVGGGTDRVWTGAADGSGGSSGSGLVGSGSPVFGHASGTRSERGFTDSWAREGNASNTNQYHIYALSDVMTVTGSPVPEPSTLALVPVALAGLGWLRRRRA